MPPPCPISCLKMKTQMSISLSDSYEACSESFRGMKDYFKRTVLNYYSQVILLQISPIQDQKGSSISDTAIVIDRNKH